MNGLVASANGTMPGDGTSVQRAVAIAALMALQSFVLFRLSLPSRPAIAHAFGHDNCQASCALADAVRRVAPDAANRACATHTEATRHSLRRTLDATDHAAEHVAAPPFRRQSTRWTCAGRLRGNRLCLLSAKQPCPHSSSFKIPFNRPGTTRCCRAAAHLSSTTNICA